MRALCVVHMLSSSSDCPCLPPLPCAFAVVMAGLGVDTERRNEALSSTEQVHRIEPEAIQANRCALDVYGKIFSSLSTVAQGFPSFHTFREGCTGTKCSSTPTSQPGRNLDNERPGRQRARWWKWLQSNKLLMPE